MDWLRFLKRFLVATLLVVSFVVTQQAFFQKILSSRQIPIETWNVFHYYLNAKYYAELRYTDLYACAIEADRTRNQVYDQTMMVRNLVTYGPVEVKRYPACPRERFSSERWSNFVNDVVRVQQAPAYLQSVYQGNLKDYLNNILTDKGYNLPPTYVVIARGAIWFTSGLGRWQLPFLGLIDAALLLVTFFVVARTFGRRSAIIGGLFVLWFWGSEGFLLGQFLQHTWLAFVLFGVCTFEKRQFTQSAVWWALAVTTRIFPIFFLVPLIPIAIQAKRDHQERWQELKRFGGIFVVSSLTLVMIGCFAGLGVEGWQLFFQKMQMHSRYLIGELFDIGFKNLLATFAPASATDLERITFFERFHWLWFGGSIISSSFILWRVRALQIVSRAWLLGLPLLYLWVVVSPYYLLSLVLVPILGLSSLEKTDFVEPSSQRVTLCLAVFFALASVHVFLGWSGIDYASLNLPMHFWSEWLVAGCMACLTLSVLPISSKTRSVSFGPEVDSSSP